MIIHIKLFAKRLKKASHWWSISNSDVMHGTRLDCVVRVLFDKLYKEGDILITL